MTFIASFGVTELTFTTILGGALLGSGVAGRLTWGFVGRPAAAQSWNGVYLSVVVRLSRPRMVGTATAAATFATFSGVLAGPTLFVQLYGWIGSYASVFGLLHSWPCSAVWPRH